MHRPISSSAASLGQRRYSVCLPAPAASAIAVHPHLVANETTDEPAQVLIGLTGISADRGLLDLNAVRISGFALRELPTAIDRAGKMRGLDCTVVSV